MKITCDFCWRLCALSEGQTGVCSVRQNQGGRVVTLTRSKVVALAVDKAEKKPLSHFYPGHRTLSFALFGCNFSCSFCQNYTISQQEFFTEREGTVMEPAELVRVALTHNTPSISFTYSEPLVWQDYLADVARLAKEAGLLTIMVTNGSFSASSRARLIPLIDAFNVDLKGDEAFYRQVCHGSAEPVLASIAAIAESGRHLEVTTMVCQKHHTPAVMETLASELLERGVQVWHLSRYFPHYQSHAESTSEQYLAQMIEIARQKGIRHVYPGNSSLDSTTYCPECHSPLIIRRGMQGPQSTPLLQNGICQRCSAPLYGHFPA